MIESSIMAESFHKSPTALSEYGDLLDVEDLTKIFRVSKQTVYKNIREGKFGKIIKIGRAIRIPKLYILKKYLSFT